MVLFLHHLQRVENFITDYQKIPSTWDIIAKGEVTAKALTNTRLFMPNRFRRLRHTATLRHLVKEHTLTPNDLLQPFLLLPVEIKEEISSMPGIYRFR